MKTFILVVLVMCSGCGLDELRDRITELETENKELDKELTRVMIGNLSIRKSAREQKQVLAKLKDLSNNDQSDSAVIQQLSAPLKLHQISEKVRQKTLLNDVLPKSRQQTATGALIPPPSF